MRLDHLLSKEHLRHSLSGLCVPEPRPRQLPFILDGDGLGWSAHGWNIENWSTGESALLLVRPPRGFGTHGAGRESRRARCWVLRDRQPVVKAAGCGFLGLLAPPELVSGGGGVPTVC